MHSNLDPVVIIDDAVIPARLRVLYPRHDIRQGRSLPLEATRYLSDNTEIPISAGFTTREPLSMYANVTRGTVQPDHVTTDATDACRHAATRCGTLRSHRSRLSVVAFNYRTRMPLEPHVDRRRDNARSHHRIVLKLSSSLARHLYKSSFRRSDVGERRENDTPVTRVGHVTTELRSRAGRISPRAWKEVPTTMRVTRDFVAVPCSFAS